MIRQLLTPLLLLVPLLVAGCGGSGTVEIAFVGGLTGRIADLGIAGRNGATLAVEEWNRRDGIDGREIILHVRDDQQSEPIMHQVANELIAGPVVAVIGPMTSSMALPMVERTNQAGLVVVSPTVTTRELSDRDDHFFRITSDTRLSADRIAEHRIRELGKRRVALVLDEGNTAYSASWAADFTQSARSLGAEVVSQTGYRSGQEIHFSQLARELIKASPDLIQIVASALDTVHITQQLRKLDPDITISATEWAATERLLELGGIAIEGLYIAQYFDRDSRLPHFLQLRSRFIQRFGYEPGYPELNAYDATNAVLTAIERHGADRETMRDALLALEPIQGAQREFRFDANGEANQLTYQAIVRGGNFVVLEP